MTLLRRQEIVPLLVCPQSFSSLEALWLTENPSRCRVDRIVSVFFFLPCIFAGVDGRYQVRNPQVASPFCRSLAGFQASDFEQPRPGHRKLGQSALVELLLTLSGVY